MGTLLDEVPLLPPGAVHKWNLQSTPTFCAVWLCLLLPLLLLELHVPVVHDSPCQLVYPHLLIRAEAQDVHGTLQREQTSCERSEKHKLGLLPACMPAQRQAYATAAGSGHGCCRMTEASTWWPPARLHLPGCSLSDHRAALVAVVTSAPRAEPASGQECHCHTHIRCQQLLAVINAGNSDFSLAHIGKVVGIGWDKEEICRHTVHLLWYRGKVQRERTEPSPEMLALTNELWLLIGHYLVKNMIAPFTG